VNCRALVLIAAAALVVLSPACTAYNQGDPEFRGMWVQQEGYSNSTQTINTVNTLASGNFNIVCMYARYYGFLFFPPTYPDTEPQYITYDALDDMIAKAHARGLQVHAWFWVNYIAATKYSNQNHVQNKHPEWLTKTNTGTVSLYWLDPGVPDAMTWNYNVAMDIVANHDVDGLHFDYVRYPYPDTRTYGYNDIAVARFMQEFNRTQPPDPDDAAFVTWRERQVTDFVKKVYANAAAIKPNVIISAAVWGRPSSGHTVLQDWVTWLQKGYIDMAVPMIYEGPDGNSYYRTCVNNDVDVANGRAMVIGQGGGDNPVSNTIYQMNYARSRGCAGEFIFSWRTSNNEGLSVADFCARLASDPTAYSTPVAVPAMPWKTTEGIVKGTVTGPDGRAIYNAQITISGKTDLTDATGFYAIMRLNPGTYTVTCQANGYAPASAQVTITGGAVTTRDFALTSEGHALDIIIDNTSAMYVGTWSTATDTTTKYGDDYRYGACSPSTGRIARWVPEIEVPGMYEVSVWYPSDTNRSVKAPYTIYYDGGSTTVRVNQTINGGQWNRLAVLPFAAGASGYIQLANGTGESASTIVCADAVRFLYVGPLDATPPTINSVSVAPPLVSGGMPITVNVSATDNYDVMSVTACGIALTRTGPDTFSGSVPTDPTLGRHAVTVVARDAVGNQAASIDGTYITAPIFGITNASLLSGGATDAASTQSLFKAWGSVTVQDSNCFTISDGSRCPVTVQCPGHGLTTGRFVTVVGIWNAASIPPELEVRPEQIQVIF